MMVSRCGQCRPQRAPGGTKARVAKAKASPRAGKACRCAAHCHAQASTATTPCRLEGHVTAPCTSCKARDGFRGQGHSNCSNYTTMSVG